MSFGQLQPIIGGGPAGAHEFPSVVHLRIETRPSWHAVCGGTLISAKHIVTAAHCLVHAPSPQSVRVGYGHSHIQKQLTQHAYALHIHQNFDARTLANDIAIVELAMPIRESAEAHRAPVYFGKLHAGRLLRTVGWGVTSNAASDHTVALMNRVDLVVAQPKECRRVDRTFASNNGPIVCTGTDGGHDECSGDSGAPSMLIDDVSGGVWLAALTSFGDNTRHDAHPLCGDPRGFGFSTHVAYYGAFISNVTGLARAQLEAPVRLDRLASGIVGFVGVRCSAHGPGTCTAPGGNAGAASRGGQSPKMLLVLFMAYQKDFDTVKTKLRDLWTQYNNSGTPTASGSHTPPAAAAATGPGSGSQTPTRAVEPLAPVEEMLLFPTYAFRDEQLKVWRVQVRGWAFCRNPTTRRVRLSAALIRRFIRIPAGGDSDRMLVDRVSYLFAGSPASTDLVKVAMAGISDPAPFELHTVHQHPNHPHEPSATHAPPVSLLDAPIVLTSRFDPASGPPSAANSSPADAQRNHMDTPRDSTRIRNAEFSGVAPTIMQKALQIDAFSWQNLVLDEGLFHGEVLLGYNELQWLVQSYQQPTSDDDAAGAQQQRRRVIELRGKLYGWPEHRVITGLAHLVEPRGISVVSDIDDTIKASNITAEKRIVLETAFARPMQAVPGMSALYRLWYDRGAEFHYVSNSPWQLYPTLDRFFHRHEFPPGSAHLRSFDPNDLLSIKNYTGTPQLKRDTIELLFRTFPDRKFVLVGDCGEHDLETYTDLVRAHPGRVLRIYIRDVFAPMSVASVTTDVDVAGNSIHNGVIPLGVVRPVHTPSVRSSAEVVEEAELISLHDDDDGPPLTMESDPPLITETASLPPPPPIPPKPAHLRPRSSMSSLTGKPKKNPPPKPARTFTSTSAPTTASSSTDRPLPLRPVLPPRPTHPLQSIHQAQPMPSLDDATAAARIEAKINELREQAQEWLAFYAQQFYVAPTRSFIRYARVFLPTVERNIHIIDYDAIPGAVHHAMSESMQPSDPNDPQMLSNMHSALSFGAFNIPEPPPTEAQLARNARRLLLWKRYLRATQGLPPDLCRLFVDADDITQDVVLFDTLFPKHSFPQI
ncbi:hypothetical protein EV175_004631 [Coemansia sp. RSA 1933]|nr:hypothetical protein EV175_004631 [Coemansia sp. RSA 1933]